MRRLSGREVVGLFGGRRGFLFLGRVGGAAGLRIDAWVVGVNVGWM